MNEITSVRNRVYYGNQEHVLSSFRSQHLQKILSPEELTRARNLGIDKPLSVVKDALAPAITKILGIPDSSLRADCLDDFASWIRDVRERGFSWETALDVLLLEPESDLSQKLIEQDSAINCTEFFRNRFQCIAFQFVLGSIFSSIGRCHARVWVPGCSTGNEAYTIAVLYKGGPHAAASNLEILGTDISRKVIEKARTGIYFGQMPGYNNLHSQYFKPIRGDGLRRFQVADEIRSMTTFRVDNLLYPRVEGPFDMVSCHNVLNHLSYLTRGRAAGILVENTALGGFLLSNDQIFLEDPRLVKVDIPQENSSDYRVFRRMS